MKPFTSLSYRAYLPTNVSYDLFSFARQLNLTKLRGVQYCDTDYQKQHQKPKTEKKDEQTVDKASTNTTKLDCPCDCRTCGKPAKKSEFNAKAEKFLDESLIDNIIDVIFPQNSPSLPLPPDPPRTKRSTRHFGTGLTDAVFAPQDFEMEFKNRWRRSISSSSDNKIEKSGDAESEKNDSSRKIVEVLDSDERHNGTSPNTIHFRRPFSKKMIGDEHRDTVYVLYSAHIPGES